MEGELGAYGIAVLSFFSSVISVKEDPLQYCGNVHCALLSNARQYFKDLRLMVNDYHYTISDR